MCIAPISSALDEIFGLLHAPTTLPQERTLVVSIEEPLSIWSESIRKLRNLFSTALVFVLLAVDILDHRFVKA
jgi:hypothetical protein